jgi:hypothetical protein
MDENYYEQKFDQLYADCLHERFDTLRIDNIVVFLLRKHTCKIIREYLFGCNKINGVYLPANTLSTIVHPLKINCKVNIHHNIEAEVTCEKARLVYNSSDFNWHFLNVRKLRCEHANFGFNANIEILAYYIKAMSEKHLLEFFPNLKIVITSSHLILDLMQLVLVSKCLSEVSKLVVLKDNSCSYLLNDYVAKINIQENYAPYWTDEKISVIDLLENITGK